MKWTVISKNKDLAPKKVASYRDYKPYLREEAEEKCVYCAIHENPLGGVDNFHVEHYRPKSLPQFSSLEKDYENLFYACAICNRFKSNDWPNDPLDDHSIVSYPDPNKVDYNSLFKLEENGKIMGNYVASKYLIEKIFLNRPQLINERREYFIRERYSKIVDVLKIQLMSLKNYSQDQKVSDLVYKTAIKLAEASELLNEEKAISRYEPNEVKKPK